MCASQWQSQAETIAVCQLTSDHDVDKNFEICKDMVKRATDRNCKMIFFPECFDYVGRNKEENISLATEENGAVMERFRGLAKESGLWISLGGLHNKDPAEPHLPWNSHIVIDAEGKTRALYNKLHLFDLEIPGKVRLMESEFSKRGSQMVHPIDTPIGRLGLSICYDLRFSELSLWNRYKGAEVLSFPSAFTVNTGLAHWEALLRARAIETQCYVVAAAQTGKHNEKRSSYGHSMVVDPWGAIVAQCSERVDMCFAEIDTSYVAELRKMQPVFEHRRSDLYTLHVNEIDNEYDRYHMPTIYSLRTSLGRSCPLLDVEDNSPMKFSEFTIAPESIFYRSGLCFAFVNLKPVLTGHVLICPKRVCNHLTDLTDAETADLFVVAKKVQRMLEKASAIGELYDSGNPNGPHPLTFRDEIVHNVSSSTVCVQDGPEAGQTVKHVHVHVLARRKGDFGCSPDNLYQNLATHDKRGSSASRDPTVRPRSQEEMTAEAAIYREAIKNI
ncbi:histidine triad domain protein [Ancylostoma duodenale]|uniref:Histidine triad domain protein n=1 Tax=Ancylostoma duodenale TaxID=51022 RepID=A0A0C2GY00_9BILA|nr:histidine triad domain protein [Ancylostoma duodenale]